MERVVSGTFPREKSYCPELGNEIITKTIKPITKENYNIACHCTGRVNCLGCARKIAMYNYINEKVLGLSS